jgi:hypothetical protein
MILVKSCFEATSVSGFSFCLAMNAKVSCPSAIRGLPTVYPFGKSERVSTYYATCAVAQGGAGHTPASESLAKTWFHRSISSCRYAITPTAYGWGVSPMARRRTTSLRATATMAFFLLPAWRHTVWNFVSKTGSPTDRPPGALNQPPPHLTVAVPADVSPVNRVARGTLPTGQADIRGQMLAGGEARQFPPLQREPDRRQPVHPRTAPLTLNALMIPLLRTQRPQLGQQLFPQHPPMIQLPQVDRQTLRQRPTGQAQLLELPILRHRPRPRRASLIQPMIIQPLANSILGDRDRLLNLI